MYSLNIILFSLKNFYLSTIYFYWFHDFRRGSVIVDMLVTVNQTGTVGGVSGTLQQAVSNGFLGTMSVDPNYIIIGQGGRYLILIKNVDILI